jgi:hypothetical protein
MACTHTEAVGGEWVENPHYDPTDEGYEGDEMIWEPAWERPTTEDVDLHHYRCTQCGKIMCY